MSVLTDEHGFTASDGLRLRVRRWSPDAPAKAAVLVVHGLAEHSGRYAELAEALCRRACVVYAFDLRGHGRSEGPRALVRSLDEHCDDLGRLLEQVRADGPQRPLFLFGHSMGGLVACRHSITRRPDLQGLVLSAAALRVGDDVYPWLRPLAPLFGRLFPRLRLVRLGAAMLSRDEDVREQFRHDPLVFHGRLPCRTGLEILRAGQDALRRAAEVRLPLLVLHGAADTLTDPAGSRSLYERASSADKTLRLYDGAWHDLAHEPEKPRVLRDVADWVAQRA